MVFVVDDPVDWVRVIIAVLGCVSVTLLVVRGYRYRSQWNQKSRDLLYSLGMWTVTGVVSVIQGIALDRELTPATVLIFASTVVALKALLTDGPFGRSNEDEE